MGTTESMYEFHGYLLESANNLIAFFMQIMELFGISNSEGAQKMQDTFQSGMSQAYGSTGDVQKTPAISPNAASKPGSILIRTTPGGVQIYIDDQYKGSTPEDSAKVLVINEVSIGSHSLDLRKPGYTFATENIQVSDGDWIVLVKELQAVPA